MRIRKYNTGSNILYSGLGNMSVKWEDWISQKLWPTPKIDNFPTPVSWKDSYKNQQQDYYKNNYQADREKQNKKASGNQVAAVGTSAATNYATDKLTDKLFDDSELGRGLGTLFSSGVSSAGNTLSDNLLKGTTLTEGLGTNAGASVAGAGAGLAANYLGQGINSLGGNTMLSRGIGQGVATGLGTVGGAAMSNLVQYGTLAGKTANGAKTALIGKAAGAINPYALAMNVVGSGLGAAFGPSKEYGGRYGNITQTMDSVYDTAMVGANFIPGVGQMVSGVMALNKGLSNVFGSTDGMTKTDAILGSAFMPAPVKWLNMWGASSTGTFDRQSWQNQQKANSFMGDAFGNLGDRFNQAREEAGKTYGTFSQGAKRDAQRNIDFANYAWGQIMDMANQNEYQNIRSQYMSSINNQRYAQAIQGGWTPLARGKQGMKILNNATNHNIGMRLLSGAALIDNKQMILSAQNGTKVKWKALDNIDYKAIPDTTFTREKTGLGSIEYFAANEPQGITYPNGFHKAHPFPGKDVILYNPKENDEQDIRLDALHIMPKDASYDALNSLYRNAAKNSDVSYNAKARYKEDVKQFGRKNVDSYQQYFNNEADGLLRNMFIEGTPEYIKSRNYYPNKDELRQQNKHLLPYIDTIHKYLKTGRRPATILNEVIVTPNKNK